MLAFNSLEKSEYLFALAWLHLNKQDTQNARLNLSEANSTLSSMANDRLAYSSDELTKAFELRNKYSWNMSCLLPQQEFSEGWSLFEYGLVTPAKGKQKWQLLLKPFSEDQIPLWRRLFQEKDCSF